MSLGISVIFGSLVGVVLVVVYGPMQREAKALLIILVIDCICFANPIPIDTFSDCGMTPLVSKHVHMVVCLIHKLIVLLCRVVVPF